MHLPSGKEIVKRNTSYACLSNELAFNVYENKGFFPYKWFDSVNMLKHSTLSSDGAFYSSLK